MDEIADFIVPEAVELPIFDDETDETAESLRKELIKHLSSEIGKQSDYLLTLRSRMAYSMLIGPFVVVGAALIALKDRQFHVPQFHGHWTIWAYLAGFSYIGLAIYGASLDRHATEQSNRWRDAILLLWNGDNVAHSDLRFTHYHPYIAHIIAYGLVILAFGSTIWLVLQLLATTP